MNKLIQKNFLVPEIVKAIGVADSSNRISAWYNAFCLHDKDVFHRVLRYTLIKRVLEMRMFEFAFVGEKFGLDATLLSNASIVAIDHSISSGAEIYFTGDSYVQFDTAVNGYIQYALETYFDNVDIEDVAPLILAEEAGNIVKDITAMRMEDFKANIDGNLRWDWNE